jgi:hypothetical protein
VAAADHEPAVLRERVEAHLEELAADMLEDHVHAAAVGGSHHLRRHVLLAVVDRDVETELPRSRQLVVRAGVADHERARQLRELQGGRADPAPDAVDQQGLAGLELRSGEEHVPGGRERDLRRGRGLVGEPIRDADQVPRRAGELLRVAAGGREADEARGQAQRLAAGAAVPAFAARVHQVRHHAVADLPAADALAERGDPPDRLDAEDERRLHVEARDAFAYVDVEVVEGARRDLDQHLARTGLRIVHLLDLQHVQPAELVEQHRLHRTTSAVDDRVRGLYV